MREGADLGKFETVSKVPGEQRAGGGKDTDVWAWPRGMLTLVSAMQRQDGHGTGGAASQPQGGCGGGGASEARGLPWRLEKGSPVMAMTAARLGSLH